MPRRLALAVLLLAPVAHAGIVRGRVTSTVGKPVPGARVQLIRLTGGSRSVADAITGLDGSFELRTELGGRFVLLTSPSAVTPIYAPQIGDPFYAGRTDLLTRDVALDAMRITPQDTGSETLEATPIAELASPTSLVLSNDLLPRANLVGDLRDLPSAFLVQSGQTGTPAFLYLRGASPNALKLTLPGLSLEDLGGGFNLSTLSSTGFAAPAQTPALELTPTPLPLHGLDAEAGLLALHTAQSPTIRPSFLYTGDAGPLATLRNEVTVSAAPTRADLLASFSRFDTANDPLQPSQFHIATAATNLGYHIAGNTSLRLTARRDVSASAYMPPSNIFALPALGKLSTQNTFGTFALETSTAGNWHNALGYGLARKRAELQLFSTPALGNPVFLRGANGYTASGTALLPVLPAREDAVTDRDEFFAQSDRPVKPWFSPLLTLHYRDERAADLTPTLNQRLDHHDFSAAAGITGEFLHHRFFYQTSGFLDDSSFLGLTGAPRAGLTYTPVHAGTRRFRGTTLHLAAATGTREPSLAEQASALNANSPLIAPRTRTLEASADQTILPRKLTVRATYFHNQFSHEFEPVNFTAGRFILVQTLAFRTQGLEAATTYNPSSHLLLTAGYTYLAALVEQSSATPTFNPAYPALPVGALTALAGARPFHRPPNSGFASASYAGRALSASIKASIAGRSDDTTGTLTTPSFLLPNRNLSPGYTSLDASATYAVTRRITLFTQLTNLFDNRHMAPIGYSSTPFLVRTGLRIRLGGE